MLWIRFWFDSPLALGWGEYPAISYLLYSSGKIINVGFKNVLIPSKKKKYIFIKKKTADDLDNSRKHCWVPLDQSSHLLIRNIM